MVLGDAVTKLQRFVWLFNHVSTAFSRTSLFLERFWRKFLVEYLVSSTNRSAKPTDLKMIFFAF